MRFILAAMLAAHGFAHLPGFISSWRLASLQDLPYKTTAFAGHVELGDEGARLLGICWLLAAGAFMVAAAGLAVEARWAFAMTAVAAAGSVVLCAAGLPEARIGLAVNVMLPLLVLASERLHLIALPR